MILYVNTDKIGRSVNAVKRKTARLGLGVLLFSGLGAGCDPISPEDRAFFAERERERANREAVMRGAAQGLRADDLIAQVRQSPAPDGEGTVDDWLEREFVRLRGQVMFPRWTAARRGSNKQEIAFDFVLIDARNNMRRLEYVWDLDVLEMTVGPPRFSQLEEMASPERALAQQQLRRIREHERQLE